MEMVVLVDHGSSVESANQAVERLAEGLSRRLGMEVVATHMELAPPLFKDFLETLASHPGLRRLLVLPLFIAGGKHLTEDIEAHLNAFSRAFPDLKVQMLPPLAEQEGFEEYLAGIIAAELASTGSF